VTCEARSSITIAFNDLNVLTFILKKVMNWHLLHAWMQIRTAGLGATKVASTIGPTPTGVCPLVVT
jgi:hypothetical protein